MWGVWVGGVGGGDYMCVFGACEVMLGGAAVHACSCAHYYHC